MRLKCELDCHLKLPRVADALSEKSVKVEEPGRDKRIDVVFTVGRIEHLDDGNDRESLAKLERPLQAPVKREILIVFAVGVAIRRGANRRPARARRP